MRLLIEIKRNLKISFPYVTLTIESCCAVLLLQAVSASVLSDFPRLAFDNPVLGRTEATSDRWKHLTKAYLLSFNVLRSDTNAA